MKEFYEYLDATKRVETYDSVENAITNIAYVFVDTRWGRFKLAVSILMGWSK